jgi:hypothetical protein
MYGRIRELVFLKQSTYGFKEGLLMQTKHPTDHEKT